MNEQDIKWSVEQLKPIMKWIEDKDVNRIGERFSGSDEDAVNTLLSLAQAHLERNNTIVITSKGEAKRILLQNPELFDEVAESMGYVKRVEFEKKLDMLEDVIKDDVSQCLLVGYEHFGNELNKRSREIATAIRGYLGGGK